MKSTGKASDVYAFALVSWEVITGHTLYEELSSVEDFKKNVVAKVCTTCIFFAVCRLCYD